MLIDTHCHIHESDYPLDGDDVICRAHEAGVMQMICVGTDEISSKEAIEFASKRDGIFASVGVHPHYAEKGLGNLSCLVDSVYLGNGFVPGPIRAPAPDRTRAAGVSLNKEVQQDTGVISQKLNEQYRQHGHQKLVAIGEIGLDYFYTHSPRDAQIEILQQQIELALKYDLPVIFHIREAFDDFWPIFDGFHGVRGVLHCFTDTSKNLEKGLERGLFIGVNGISTFTKDEAQKTMFTSVPLDRLLLETDAPLLTPHPLRGKIKVNEPAFVREIAEYNAAIHQISFDEVANATTTNARAFFHL